MSSKQITSVVEYVKCLRGLQGTEYEFRLLLIWAIKKVFIKQMVLAFNKQLFLRTSRVKKYKRIDDKEILSITKMRVNIWDMAGNPI